jgi:hypothetical protein
MNKINLNVNFSTFLEKIKLKKQYLYHVKNKLKIINKLKDKNYKKVNSNIYNSEIKFGNTLVSYIIEEMAEFRFKRRQTVNLLSFFKK